MANDEESVDVLVTAPQTTTLSDDGNASDRAIFMDTPNLPSEVRPERCVSDGFSIMATGIISDIGNIGRRLVMNGLRERRARGDHHNLGGAGADTCLHDSTLGKGVDRTQDESSQDGDWLLIGNCGTFNR